MTRSCRVAFLLAAVGASAPSAAGAATQGMLGTSSTGSIDITLTSTETPVANIQISGLQDAAFGSVQVGTIPPANVQNQICVYMTTMGTYQLTTTANTLVNPSGMTTLNYQLIFSDLAGNQHVSDSGGPPFSSGGLQPSSNPMCGMGAYASLSIQPQTVPARSHPMDNGQFAGTLTVTVTPE